MAVRIKVEGTVGVHTNYGKTEAEFYFHTTLKKYNGIIELYQLRNIKRQIKCEYMNNPYVGLSCLHIGLTEIN